MGPIALILGLILCLVAFATNTAPAGTHNLGLLQQQMMTLHCGLALLIISAIRFPTSIAAPRAVTVVSAEDEETRRARLKRHDRITYGVLGGFALFVLALAFLVY